MANPAAVITLALSALVASPFRAQADAARGTHLRHGVRVQEGAFDRIDVEWPRAL
jgi:hypothetical protein